MNKNDSIVLKQVKNFLTQQNISDGSRAFNDLLNSTNPEAGAEAFYWLAILKIKQYRTPRQALDLCYQAIQNNSNHSFAYYLATYINLCLAYEKPSQQYLEDARKYYSFGKKNKYLPYDVDKFFIPFIETKLYEGIVRDICREQGDSVEYSEGTSQGTSSGTWDGYQSGTVREGSSYTISSGSSRNYSYRKTFHILSSGLMR